MPRFKRKPAKLGVAKQWGTGKVSVKGGKFFITPKKRAGVNVGKRRRIK